MMNSYTILEAVGEVNDCFISALLEEKPTQRKLLSGRSIRWIAAAACLCLIVGGMIYQHTKVEQPTLGFAITAYAKSPDGKNLKEVILKLSEPVPVDAFYSDNGQPVFVFSYPAENNNPHFAITHILDYRVSSYPNLSIDTLRSITGIEELPENEYFYYLPDIKDASPYTFFFSIGYIEDKSLITVAYFQITESETQYFVELVDIKNEKANIYKTEDMKVTYDENGNIVYSWINPNYRPQDDFPGGWNMDTFF